MHRNCNYRLIVVDHMGKVSDSMGKNILETLWLNSKFFDNCTMGSIQNTSKIHGLDAAYKIWEEANHTIENCKGNLEKMNQGFLSLKRAFNVASSELKKNVGLDKIRYSGKKKRKDFLADLEYFEITKTLTINKYLKIRNLIEHENETPPLLEDCLSLSEYIWNYIRTIANILRFFSECVIFSQRDYPNNEIYFDYVMKANGKEFSPHLYVTGFVKAETISFIYRDKFLEMNEIKLLNKRDMQELQHLKDSAHCLNELRDIAFTGEILNQDILAQYVKYSTLPELGGLNERSIQTIFSKI